MKEEEEDRVLLSSLGVTSANPEDIECHILAKESISVSMLLHETSFCFVCSHLTSGLKEGEEILNKTGFHECIALAMRSPHKQSFNIHSIFGEDIIETAKLLETLLAPPPNTPNKKSKKGGYNPSSSNSGLTMDTPMDSSPTKNSPIEETFDSPNDNK